MLSVITNIYNKKTKGPTLMELFAGTGKLKVFFTTRDVRCVHHCHVTSQERIIAAVKNINAPMLTCVWQELEYRIDCAVSPMVHTSNNSSCQKYFFSFPVAVNNSNKLSPLVFLL
jgi:hypothetical protein